MKCENVLVQNENYVGLQDINGILIAIFMLETMDTNIQLQVMSVRSP